MATVTVTQSGWPTSADNASTWRVMVDGVRVGFFTKKPTPRGQVGSYAAWSFSTFLGHFSGEAGLKPAKRLVSAKQMAIDAIVCCAALGTMVPDGIRKDWLLDHGFSV